MQVADKISIKPFPRLRVKTFPVLILFFFSSFQGTFAQFKDDFSDGDFLSDPAWQGSTNHFIVNESHQLQLNAPIAGRSWLTADLSPASSQAIQWQISVRQAFSPSGSNYGRFYLISDQPDLSAPLNGYYLQFGQAGTEDAVELFRQSGTTSTSICRARPGAIASPFTIRVKVQHFPDGAWHLFADYLGGTDYVPECSGVIGSDVTGSYFGVLCNYTVSNVRGFYFDDIQIEALDVPDTTPPSIDSVEVVDSRTLKVGFSEPLDPASVIAENFTVTPGQQPIAITLDEEWATATLVFGPSFPNGVQSTLHVHDIADHAGNTMLAANMPFLFFEELPIVYRDVVISEIFSDPAPPRTLPEAEFLELYNRSSIPVDLSGWVLSDNTNIAVLPSHLLLPKQYVILTGRHSSEDFARYGTALGVDKFPSLNNAGDKLTLKDDLGQTIDSVNYSIDWYHDDEKSDGGWSLERIDPDDLCSEGANWIASEAPDGGTPGSQNAVYASRPDYTGPRLLSIVAIDSLSLLISFDEKLDKVLPSKDEFLTDGGLTVDIVRFADPARTILSLILSGPIQRGKLYTLRIGNVYDCPGNRIHADHAHGSFLLPEDADAGDIVINEVLFNPRPTGVDFVEVFNTSTKVIDLQHWAIRNSAAAFPVSDRNLLLFPGQYLVFTDDADVLKGEYIMGVEGTFIETKLPPLNDDEGSVSLLDQGGLMIDSIHYSDDLHSEILKDDEGVSLERISAAAGSKEGSNWRSASSVSGFATPGYVNSNSRGAVAMRDGTVIVAPEIIRQQVVQQDFARIQYQFERGGLIANVRICDQQGRRIRTIAENELLGTEGFFRWDGDTDNHLLAPTGYYMVLFELFNLDGHQQTFRKRVAVF